MPLYAVLSVGRLHTVLSDFLATVLPHRAFDALESVSSLLARPPGGPSLQQVAVPLHTFS